MTATAKAPGKHSGEEHLPVLQSIADYLVSDVVVLVASADRVHDRLVVITDYQSAPLATLAASGRRLPLAESRTVAR